MQILVIRVSCHKYSHEVAEVIPPVCAACIKPAKPKIILYKRVNYCKSDLYWTVCGHLPGGGCDVLKPALMKGGGPYPGGGILMVTGKVGGTRPTALGTAWATGSWMREI